MRRRSPLRRRSFVLTVRILFCIQHCRIRLPESFGHVSWTFSQDDDNYYYCFTPSILSSPNNSSKTNVIVNTIVVVVAVRTVECTGVRSTFTRIVWEKSVEDIYILCSIIASSLGSGVSAVQSRGRGKKMVYVHQNMIIFHSDHVLHWLIIILLTCFIL